MPCTTGACLLTTGLNAACTNRAAGGNRARIWVINRCQVEDFVSYGYNSESTITGFTLSAGAVWRRVSALRNTVTTTEDVVDISNAVTQTVSFSIGKFGDDIDKEDAAAQVIDFLNDIKNQDEGLVVVVEDNNGVRFIYGEDSGLFIQAPSSRTSGAAFTEVATTALVLAGGNSSYGKVLAPSVVLTT